MSSKKPTTRKPTTRKVRVQPKTIEEFYKARGKDPSRFTINKQGDLVAAAVKEGEAERIFTLPKYRSPTIKEIQNDDADRRAAITTAEEAVQTAQHALRETLMAYRANKAYAADVVVANIEVTNKEKALQSIAYPVRNIETIDSIDTRKILLDQRYEKRKFPYPVNILKRQAFPLQVMYAREGEEPEEDVVPAPAVKPKTFKVKRTVAAAADGTGSSAMPGSTAMPGSSGMSAADRGRLGGILKVRKSVA